MVHNCHREKCVGIQPDCTGFSLWNLYSEGPIHFGCYLVRKHGIEPWPRISNEGIIKEDGALESVVESGGHKKRSRGCLIFRTEQFWSGWCAEAVVMFTNKFLCHLFHCNRPPSTPSFCCCQLWAMWLAQQTSFWTEGCVALFGQGVAPSNTFCVTSCSVYIFSTRAQNKIELHTFWNIYVPQNNDRNSAYVHIPV